ncbi:MAG TPA: GFA family protein, partial [Rhodanobacteraceae bacterium]|nr:GFA family protein [Rhodanobacteraceae bacterium]
TIEGHSREYAQAGDSGAVARFRFCGNCGATVCWEADGVPGFVTVAVGAFADPHFPQPRVSVYEERQHAWLRMPDDIEHFD